MTAIPFHKPSVVIFLDFDDTELFDALLVALPDPEEPKHVAQKVYSEPNVERNAYLRR